MAAEAPLVAGFIDQSNGKNTFEIDFGALKAKASEMLNAADPVEPVVAPVVIPAEPVVVAPDQVRVKGATSTPAVVEPPAVVDEVVETADATPQTLSQLADDALVSVPVDGVDTTMTWKEAKAGFSRTAKFTQSMQKLAQDRSGFESEKANLTRLQSERDGLEKFLQNPKAILNYIAQEFPDALQGAQSPAVPQGTNPDEIVTYREAQAIAAQQTQALQARVAEVEAQVGKRIESATHEIERRTETAKHAAVLSATLTDIFATNPVLKSIPNSEDLMRFEVSKLQPQTQEEAVQAFRQVAQGMVEEIGKHFKAQTKIAKVAEVKAKLESKSIEPAGGSAPQIAPTTFKNPDGSVNWNKVRDMAIAAA